MRIILKCQILVGLSGSLKVIIYFEQISIFLYGLTYLVLTPDSDRKNIISCNRESIY